MNRGCSSSGVPVPPASTRLVTLVIGLAVIVAVLAVPRSARACTFPVRPLEEYADEVDVAFVGSEIDRREGGNRSVVTFEVHRVYKGKVGPRITFEVAGYNSSCSVYFRSETNAVLAQLVEEDAYGFKAGDLAIMLESDVVSEADLEEVFGDGYPPDDKGDPATLGESSTSAPDVHEAQNVTKEDQPPNSTSTLGESSTSAPDVHEAQDVTKEDQPPTSTLPSATGAHASDESSDTTTNSAQTIRLVGVGLLAVLLAGVVVMRRLNRRAKER